MNWQPIKTAPKDGTNILVWDGWSYYVTRWTDSSCGYYRKKEWCIGGTMDDYNSLQTVEPTHWMPLPDAPQAMSETDILRD